MNNIAKETQIELKTKAFEMAQDFYLLSNNTNKEKLVELAKEIYGFLASEPEKSQSLIKKLCPKCGCRMFSSADSTHRLYKCTKCSHRDEQEKNHDFTKKPCHKCGHLRAGRILPNGRSQWADCIKCGYPFTAKKRYEVICRECDYHYFYEKKRNQRPPKYCPWCASENTFLSP